MPTEPGRAFRAAWIAGVQKHYPGEPKPGYVAPWEQTPDWEREAATAVYHQVRAFIEATNGQTAKLTRLQKGRFVALCWIGQIHKHFPDPKPSYLADWDDLPSWQQETDADIFEHIERDVRDEHDPQAARLRGIRPLGTDPAGGSRPRNGS